MTDEKKGLFGKAIDKLSDRDEIEKLEKAEQKIAELEEQLEEAKSDDELSEAEEKIQELEKELKKSKSREARQAFLRRKEALLKKKEAKRKRVKKHVVKPGDTLSGLAKKYYGDPGKYMVIYKANKEVIGDDPDLIVDGTELVIPELPEEGKDKGGSTGSGPKSI